MEERRFDLAGYIIFNFLGGLILFMLFWTLLDSFAVEFFEIAIREGGAARSQGATYLQYAWTFAPALVLTILSLDLISRAVFESRGGAA
jgi:heme/copper-type cytochrome/quinol oxidase subunit 2